MVRVRFAYCLLLAASCGGSPTIIPQTADVVCDHVSIPCGDSNATTITCSGGYTTTKCR